MEQKILDLKENYIEKDIYIYIYIYIYPERRQKNIDDLRLYNNNLI